ncbi:uncharacterized protein METZ01_LOCUS471741, partial [marine metagenome]
MKKYILLAIVFTNLTNIFGQVSASDIKKLSNAQLDVIRSELKKDSALPTSLDDSLENTKIISSDLPDKVSIAPTQK